MGILRTYDEVDLSRDSVEIGKIERFQNKNTQEKTIAFIVGESIRAQRIALSLSQGQLAGKLGKQKSYISRLENGEINITVEKLTEIFEKGFNRKISLFISDLAPKD